MTSAGKFLDYNLTAEPNTPVEIALYVLCGFVLAVGWLLAWRCCCGGLQKGRLNLGNLIEATLCWPCMWADMSTRLGFIGRPRAWFYVICTAVLGFAWHTTATARSLPSMKQLENGPQGGCADNDTRCWEAVIVHCTFGGLMVLLWLAFAMERCFTRKLLRTKTRDEDYACANCADLIASCCFPTVAALQESQLAAELDLEAPKRGTGKWPDEA